MARHSRLPVNPGELGTDRAGRRAAKLGDPGDIEPLERQQSDVHFCGCQAPGLEAVFDQLAKGAARDGRRRLGPPGVNEHATYLDAAQDDARDETGAHHGLENVMKTPPLVEEIGDDVAYEEHRCDGMERGQNGERAGRGVTST